MINISKYCNKENETESQSEAGFALIFVLGFLFVVTLVVTPFTIQSRSIAQSASNVSNIQKLENLATGLIEVLADRILNRDWESPISFEMNGSNLSCRSAKILIQASVQDHRGLIDLNSASERVLELGFKALDLNSATSTNYARTVVYLRSIENLERPLGIFNSTKKRGFGRFSSALELLDIESGEHLDHRKISRIFTVHTRAPRPENRLLSRVLSDAAQSIQQNTSLQLQDTGPAFSNGVYTFNITLKNRQSGLVSSISKVVALGIYRGSPVQPIETIPARFFAVSIPDTSESCGRLLGENVSELLEKIA